MTILANILIILLISLGVIFSVVTAVGLIRLPDVYTRTHAASKSATLGVLGILAGVFIHFWLIEGHFNSRLILAIVFLFITSPVAGHIMGRAAYMGGVELSHVTVADDLKKAIDRKKKLQK